MRCLVLGFSAFMFLNSLGAAIVADCNETALRAAIQTGEPVIFGCDGTIVLSNTIVVETNLVLDARGRNVVIDGAESNRLFDVNGSVTFTLWNLSLVNGRATERANAIVRSGGAIYVSPFVRLEAYHCSFRGNVAHGVDGAPFGWGGAISAWQATLVLSNCVFEANTAGDGGAIYCVATPVLATDCTFVDNVAARISANPNSPGQYGEPRAAKRFWSNRR